MVNIDANLLNQGLIPFLILVSLNTQVVVVGIVVGGVWCSRSQASTFSCYSWTPSDTEHQKLYNGGVKAIKKTVL